MNLRGQVGREIQPPESQLEDKGQKAIEGRTHFLSRCAVRRDPLPEEKSRAQSPQNLGEYASARNSQQPIGRKFINSSLLSREERVARTQKVEGVPTGIQTNEKSQERSRGDGGRRGEKQPFSSGKFRGTIPG